MSAAIEARAAPPFPPSQSHPHKTQTRERQPSSACGSKCVRACHAKGRGFRQCTWAAQKDTTRRRRWMQIKEKLKEKHTKEQAGRKAKGQKQKAKTKTKPARTSCHLPRGGRRQGVSSALGRRLPHTRNRAVTTHQTFSPSLWSRLLYDCVVLIWGSRRRLDRFWGGPMASTKRAGSRT